MSSLLFYRFTWTARAWVSLSLKVRINSSLLHKIQERLSFAYVCHSFYSFPSRRRQCLICVHCVLKIHRRYWPQFLATFLTVLTRWEWTEKNVYKEITGFNCFAMLACFIFSLKSQIMSSLFFPRVASFRNMYTSLSSDKRVDLIHRIKK